MTETSDSYVVSVKSADGKTIDAFVGPAYETDMPIDWTFDWPYIWKRTDFGIQSIIKLSVAGNLWGLVKYGLYAGKDSEDPEIMVVEQLETHPSRDPTRSVFRKPPPPAPAPYIKPVGQWLMWYACEIALESCILGDDKPLVVLSATTSAVDYYIDIIGMTMSDVGPSTYGEDSYGFSFDADQAEDFCALRRLASGKPKPI